MADKKNIEKNKKNIAKEVNNAKKIDIVEEAKKELQKSVIMGLWPTIIRQFLSSGAAYTASKYFSVSTKYKSEFCSIFSTSYPRAMATIFAVLTALSAGLDTM